ncbi:MAG: hypothetical protein ACRD38_10705, partial [Nitrososphaerales archaeon]
CVLCIDMENVFSVDDTLRLSGTSTPNDTLIAELFNPNGALVSRTQITVGSDGVFSRTLLQWTLPTQNLPFGTYTLIVRSTLNEERRATEVLKFQPAIPEIPEDVGRELAVQISAPSAIGANETAKVIVQVTINNILIKIDPAETLKDSHIHFPDGSIRPIETFAVLEDGIYYTDFTSRMLGHYTIHVQAFQQGLIANSVSVVLVQEGSFSSLSKEVSELNTNVEGLRQETVKKTEELGSSVSRIESASGQVTSLLLPIIGMIAIIVALQATMLARRK